MRRNRRKIVLLLLLVLAGNYIWQKQNSEIEVLKTVKESTLEQLMSTEEHVDETEKKDKNIRVLIMGNGYKGEVHSKVILSSSGEMCLQSGEKKYDIDKGEEVVIKPDDKRFEQGKIRISSEKKIALKHLERGYGTPEYEGEFELITTAEGIVVINELPVETYLKAVVPSEMPASYELEALKAQAVCARTYAYRQMENYGYPEYQAHVNDSTDYQVYGNSKAQKSTNQAIKETCGQVVYFDGNIVTTYYYSTSCGKTTDMRAWGAKHTGENAYLKAVDVKEKKEDYEKELPWYRWSAEIPATTMSNLIGLNTGKDIGMITDIEVTKRGGGDIAMEIKVTGEKGAVTVETENKIRAALGGEGYQITLNDGSVTESRQLLPSAFFTVRKDGEKFVIEGGGFGHGIGMSQNGANEMAKKGRNYREILELFYQDIEVR